MSAMFTDKMRELPIHIQAVIEKRAGFDGRKLDSIENAMLNYGTSGVTPGTGKLAVVG